LDANPKNQFKTQMKATTTAITEDTRIFPWFGSPQSLTYVHIVEVNHKGYGVSFNSLLFSNLLPKQ
jgi:phenylpyruvate tautomerase PptA (4-oxalocrotonate tautomerase family)